MDYEKEWKRAFDEASVIHQAGNKDVQQIIEQIFPLLNESERMREFLHHVFTAQYLCKDKLGKWHGEPVTNILAWLEKKGEEKPTQKLSKEQEYILNRIVEYLEDNDCPSEWKELLLDIHNAPYTEQKPHLELKAGKWYICHRAYCCRADHLTVKEGETFLCEKDGVVKGLAVRETLWLLAVGYCERAVSFTHSRS